MWNALLSMHIFFVVTVTAFRCLYVHFKLRVFMSTSARKKKRHTCLSWEAAVHTQTTYELAPITVCLTMLDGFLRDVRRCLLQNKATKRAVTECIRTYYYSILHFMWLITTSAYVRSDGESQINTKYCWRLGFSTKKIVTHWLKWTSVCCRRIFNVTCNVSTVQNCIAHSRYNTAGFEKGAVRGRFERHVLVSLMFLLFALNVYCCHNICSQSLF